MPQPGTPDMSQLKFPPAAPSANARPAPEIAKQPAKETPAQIFLIPDEYICNPSVLVACANQAFY